MVPHPLPEVLRINSFDAHRLNAKFFNLPKINMAGMIRGSFRTVMSKRDLWTLEAVLRRIAILPWHTLPQKRRGRRLAASAFNKSRTLFMGGKFHFPENGHEWHTMNGFWAI